jgi:hypothetical protein
MYLTWLKPETWKHLRIALWRAPKDPRARVMLLRLALSLIIFIAWLAFQFYNFRGMSVNMGRSGNAVLAVIAAALVLLIGGNAVSARLEHRKLERTSPSVAPAMKLALYREACLLATLLERLGSESYMEKELPPNLEVITRRVLLNRLRAVGLREELEPWVLDLLLAPDGHWTAEQKLRATRAWELFAIMLWVLGLSGLRALTEDPKYNLTAARSLFAIKQPKKLMVRPSWDLRPVRNAASSFFDRCWTELAARGELNTTTEEDVERALEVRAEIASEGYTGDYLVGTQTIAELNSPTLWMVTTRAYRRWDALSHLIDIMTGDAPPEHLRAMLASIFAPLAVQDAVTAREPA